jgi:hypothetical protein
MPKLSLSRAWEESTNVIARDGRLLLAVALALFVLPGLVLNVSMPDAVPGALPPPGAWIPIAGIAVLVSLTGQLAVIRLAMEPHLSVGEAIVHGLKRLLPYIVAVLVWILPILLVGSVLYDLSGVNSAHPSVAAALGLLLLTAIGVYVGVKLMLSSAVASAENIGPFAIIARSWRLSMGNWWRLFAFLLLFGIGALCLLLAVESVAGLLLRTVVEDSGPRSLGGLLIAIVSQVISALLSVVFFVMLARIYAQLSGRGAGQASVPNSGT